MPDLTLLTKLLSTFGDDAPACDASLCLNQRFKAANCHLCADACPVAAITVQGANVRIAPETCVHCGICLHVCPTGVFAAPNQAQADKRLLDAAAPLAGRALELTCPANRQVDRTAAPVEAVVQSGRCLAALSLAELLDLAQPRQRNLWLDDSDCAACPLGQALPVIQETATQANLVLAAWHHPIELRTQITEPDALTTVHRVAVFSGQQPSYSRREFLTFVRHTTTQVMSTVAVEALAPLNPMTGSPQPRGAELSYQRRHLTASVARLGPPPSAAMLTDSLPWVTVQISDACTACSLCARFCPTAAIRWTTQTQTPATDAAAAQPVTTFDLNFIAADCVDCGICQAACPEDAITLPDSVNPAQIGRRQMQTLRQGHLGPCRICTIATDLAVRSTCHVCNMSLTKKRKRLKG